MTWNDQSDINLHYQPQHTGTKHYKLIVNSQTYSSDANMIVIATTTTVTHSLRYCYVTPIGATRDDVTRVATCGNHSVFCTMGTGYQLLVLLTHEKPMSTVATRNEQAFRIIGPTYDVGKRDENIV